MKNFEKTFEILRKYEKSSKIRKRIQNLKQNYRNFGKKLRKFKKQNLKFGSNFPTNFQKFSETA